MATPALELTVPGPDGPRTVRVSNPDKLYFPELGVTKSDVVHYFSRSATASWAPCGTVRPRWNGGRAGCDRARS